MLLVWKRTKKQLYPGGAPLWIIVFRESVIIPLKKPKFWIICCILTRMQILFRSKKSILEMRVVGKHLWHFDETIISNNFETIIIDSLDYTT